MERVKKDLLEINANQRIYDTVNEVSAEIDQNYVRNEWFRDYLTGNALWPQESVPGILIMSLSSVFINPPKTWPIFFKSRLSTEQLDLLGVSMTNMHRHKGINYAIEEYAIPTERIVSTERLQLQWTGTKNLIRETLFNYAYPDEKINGNIREAMVERYFTNPSNEQNIEQLISIMDIARGTLGSKEGLELSRKYLNTFSLPQSLERSSIRGSCFQEVDKIVKSTIEQKIPIVDLSWLELDPYKKML